MNEKLIIEFRKITHTIRYFSDGKGGQKRVLMVLLKNQPMTQQKLTEHLDIKPGSVSEVLSKLENQGLILRQVNLKDRRTSDIYLTEEGMLKAKHALAEKEKNYASMFSCLSQQEKEELLVLLKKVNKHNGGKI